MINTQLSPDLLKQAVLELVAECRERLPRGVVDVSEVNRGVQAYCTAIAALPLEEGRQYTQDLEALMQVVSALGDELVVARDAVRAELNALNRVQRANMAYQKSDAIGEKYHKKESEQ